MIARYASETGGILVLVPAEWYSETGALSAPPPLSEAEAGALSGPACRLRLYVYHCAVGLDDMVAISTKSKPALLSAQAHRFGIHCARVRPAGRRYVHYVMPVMDIANQISKECVKDALRSDI